MPGVIRRRKVLFTLWLYPHERAALRAIARARKSTAASIVRDWIATDAPAHFQAPKTSNARKQLQLFAREAKAEAASTDATKRSGASADVDE